MCASVDIATRDPRVRADEHDRGQRVRRPDLEAYLGELGARTAETAASSRAAGHGLVGERDDDRHRARGAGLDRDLGHRGGRDGGSRVSRERGRPNLLTLDVGGTSSDIALISGLRPRLTTEWFIEFGVPIRLPAIDIHTIGAGGGSIAAVDVGGVLHVGPESAGADPGPACYGRGGTQPTTTDAQVDPRPARLRPAGRSSTAGRWTLEAAERAVGQGRRAARPRRSSRPPRRSSRSRSTTSSRRSASSVSSAATTRATFALGRLTAAPGRCIAVDIARELEIPEVIIPPRPGVTSAMGLLQVDLAVRTQRSLLMAGRRDRRRAHQPALPGDGAEAREQGARRAGAATCACSARSTCATSARADT